MDEFLNEKGLFFKFLEFYLQTTGEELTEDEYTAIINASEP